MRRLIILLSLSLTFSLHAQNYRLFNESSAKAFTSYAAPHKSYSISFDSVIYENGDSVYYNFYALPPTWNFISENCEFWGTNQCYKQNYPVWMGAKVIEDNNSYLFFNLWDDTLSFIFSPDATTQSINLSGVESGVYLMNILMENGSVFTKKIIVSN